MRAVSGTISPTPATAAPNSDVAKLAKLAATTSDCVGGCQSSFRSGDKPWVGGIATGGVYSATCRNVGNYKSYDECKEAGRVTGWPLGETSAYCSSVGCQRAGAEMAGRLALEAGLRGARDMRDRVGRGVASRPHDRNISVTETRRHRLGDLLDRFLEQAFRTDAYRCDITFNDDGSWTYLIQTELFVRGAPFNHRHQHAAAGRAAEAQSAGGDRERSRQGE